ncbi:hypothetical protein STANM337S_02193 [Streptomyces tanashiensis]
MRSAIRPLVRGIATIQKGQDAGGPGEFDAAGAQRVGEDAARVVAEGGGGEALLVDVQLVDDRVTERVVEVRAGAEQPGRLAGGG